MSIRKYKGEILMAEGKVKISKQEIMNAIGAYVDSKYGVDSRSVRIHIHFGDIKSAEVTYILKPKKNKEG